MSNTTKSEYPKNIQMIVRIPRRDKEKIEENFYRPAYGKIGERRVK